MHGKSKDFPGPENIKNILVDPRFKTLKLLPHSKECGFKSMDIKLRE